MREILFRGLEHSGVWRIGDLINWNCERRNEWTAIKEGIVSHCVKESTVGQCTGLKDKNGKKIFEGDRVKIWSKIIFVNSSETYYFEGDVIFKDGQFQLNKTRGTSDFIPSLKQELISTVEIIGNIHEAS